MNSETDKGLRSSRNQLDGLIVLAYGGVLACGASWCVMVRPTLDHWGLLGLAMVVLMSGLALRLSERSRFPIVVASCLVAATVTVLGISTQSVERTLAMGSLSGILLAALLAGRAGKWRRWLSVAGLLLLATGHLRHSYFQRQHAAADNLRPINLALHLVDDESDWSGHLTQAELPEGWSIRREFVPLPDGADHWVSYLNVEVPKSEVPKSTDAEWLHMEVLNWLNSTAQVPEGRMFGIQRVRGSGEEGGRLRSYLLRDGSLLGNEHIEEARLMEPDAEGARGVSLSFTEAGLERIRKLTTENQGRRIAILFEGFVATAPRVSGPIARNPIVISMDRGATEWEAQLLVDGLNRKLYAEE